MAGTPRSGSAPRRRGFWRVLGDVVLSLVLAGFTVLFLVLGGIGYPFEIPSRNGPERRGEYFRDLLERGEHIWFADHLVWFPIAGMFALVTLVLIRFTFARGSGALRRIVGALTVATSVTSVAVLLFLAARWVLGAPPADPLEFAEGLPYLGPVIASVVLVVVSGLATWGAWRAGYFGRPSR